MALMYNFAEGRLRSNLTFKVGTKITLLIGALELHLAALSN